MLHLDAQVRHFLLFKCQQMNTVCAKSTARRQAGQANWLPPFCAKPPQQDAHTQTWPHGMKALDGLAFRHITHWASLNSRFKRAVSLCKTSLTASCSLISSSEFCSTPLTCWHALSAFCFNSRACHVNPQWVHSQSRLALRQELSRVCITVHLVTHGAHMTKSHGRIWPGAKTKVRSFKMGCANEHSQKDCMSVSAGLSICMWSQLNRLVM